MHNIRTSNYPIRDLLDMIRALVILLAALYASFALCRMAFLLTNWHLYAGNLTFRHAVELFRAGFIFDTPAILYLNAPILVFVLLPLHLKERPGFYRCLRWMFVIVNFVGVAANLIDCVYFQFTGKRTTLSVLNEFSNEGAGNMTKILAEQFIANWYLVLLAIIIGIGFWKLYRRPTNIPVLHKPAYYILYSLLIIIITPLTIAGIRGGFSSATRPITISNANQYVNKASETGIVLNTPFAIIRTFNKTPFVTPNYMAQEEVENYFSPIHIPADSVQFKAKNVVVFILESFGKQHIGYYNKTLNGGTYKGFTPFLDSLITHCALTYQYSYANGRKSIEGMPSILSSLPNYVEPLFLTPASLNRMSGLARELCEHKGYSSAFFHGAINGSMGFEAFAKATGFQRYFGRTEYKQDPNYHGDDDFDGTWAIYDEEFLQFYCDRMNEMQEPFMTAVFTASSHTPYHLPERYKGRFPKGVERIQECVAYSDNALRNFFNKAKHQKRKSCGLNSLHNTPCFTTPLGMSCVPIILFSPSDSTLRGYDTERVVQQADIMPTVLNYLDYDIPYFAFGQDMLNTPADKTIAMHWVPEVDGYEFVKGNYAIEFDGNRVTHAYHYRTDSTLQHNVLHTMPQDTLSQMERQMKAFIQSYMYRMNNNKLTVEE